MFTDISERLVYNPPMLGYGIAVADVNGDGRFEFFVAGFGFPNRVLAWDGANLIDWFDPVLAASDRRAIGVGAGDIDGDGREEIYVLNTDTFRGVKRFGDNLFAFRDGAWSDLFQLPANYDNVNLVAGRSVCVTDRFGSGRYGFVVANYGGPFRLYETNGGGELHDEARDAGIAKVTGGRALVSLPLVSPPGRMDIFAANEGGANFLFVNNGDGTYTDHAAELGLCDASENGRGIAVFDADHNGKFDLCVGNWQGEHRLFLQTLLGGFMDAAPPEMARPSSVRTVICADFDNDGYEEIFFNNIGERNRLFAWRGNGWERVPIGDAEEAVEPGTGAAVCDIDGDGRLELLVSRGEQGARPLALYRADGGAGNAWLRVLPLTRFGAPARGAVVTLTTRARVQRRAIDAGSGYLCQMEPVAHFGLGAETEVESVTVVFPGGAVAVVERPASRQTLRVAHP